MFRIYLNKKLIKQGSTKVGKVIDTTALDGRDIKVCIHININYSVKRSDVTENRFEWQLGENKVI